MKNASGQQVTIEQETDWASRPEPTISISVWTSGLTTRVILSESEARALGRRLTTAADDILLKVKHDNP